MFRGIVSKFQYASETALLKMQVEGPYPLGFCTLNRHPTALEPRETEDHALVSLGSAEELVGKP